MAKQVQKGAAAPRRAKSSREAVTAASHSTNLTSDLLSEGPEEADMNASSDNENGSGLINPDREPGLG